LLKKPKRRPKRRRNKPMNEQATTMPKESVIQPCCDWHDQIMAGVAELIGEEVDGLTCVTTPDGRACHVHVWFKEGGSA